MGHERRSPRAPRAPARRAGARLGPGEFAKYHALGNDYLVLDEARAPTPARVRRLCDRHAGVGADGVLLRAPARGADFGLRIWNPDGGEAEKSGNGLRIFARFLRDFGYTRRTTFSISTKSGVVRAELRLRRGAVAAVRVEMGRARFESRAVGARGPRRDMVSEELRAGGRRWRATCVSVGNPHCVLFRPRLAAAELARLGPQLVRHPLFPRGVNVQLARVRGPHRIDALVYERGAGETLASGSSACAVAAAAVRTGRCARRVRVHMPGGALDIEVGEALELTLTGPATPVACGRVLFGRP